MNVDGQEVIYEFGAPSGVERVASCETEVDPDHPVFVAAGAALEAVRARRRTRGVSPRTSPSAASIVGYGRHGRARAPAAGATRREPSSRTDCSPSTRRISQAGAGNHAGRCRTRAIARAKSTWLTAPGLVTSRTPPATGSVDRQAEEPDRVVDVDPAEPLLAAAETAAEEQADRERQVPHEGGVAGEDVAHAQAR